MSLYFKKKLSPEMQRRYLAKIKVIGNIDPCDCDESGFSKDISDLPSNLPMDIINYLVTNKSVYTQEQLNAFRSLKAYKYYQCGWVRDLNMKKFGKLVLVKGKVMHSQRVNEELLAVWIIAEKAGRVLSGHCTCTAGLLETCNHLAAVLFAIQDAKSQEQDVSVTGLKNKWEVPRGRNGRVADAGLWPEKAEKLRVVRSYVVPSLPPEALFYIQKTMKDSGIIAPLVESQAPYCFALSEEYSKYETSNPLRDLHDVCYTALSLYELHVKSSDLLITTTKEHCELIEKKPVVKVARKVILHYIPFTHGSFFLIGNRAWVEQRVGRITASNLKKACSTDINNPAVSAIKAICYPTTFYSPHHESVAVTQYLEAMKKCHTDFVVEKTGLILSPNYPQFGASPDGLASCSCCSDRCLEVKCPFSLKDQIITDNLPAYLEKKGDVCDLRRNHLYYYQIQMQMALTDRELCDFVVRTSRQLLIIQVDFDSEFWLQESDKATKFWRQVILPELYGKYFTRERGEATTEEQVITNVEPQLTIAEQQWMNKSHQLPGIMNEGGGVVLLPETRRRKPDDTVRQFFVQNQVISHEVLGTEERQKSVALPRV